jgi:ketosteroid isomerase-like protein
MEQHGDGDMAMASTLQERFAQRINTYLEVLERGDIDAICALFAPDAQVFSPILGWVRPSALYTKLRDASGQSRLTPIDICVSTSGAPRATAYFVYDWVLKDGSAVRFDCVDVFEFDANGLIERMKIIYDTHLVRDTVGDQFS